MKINSAAAILFVAVMVSACSSEAGPFVTNISSDGRGGLNVEKCMVKLDRNINTVQASQCTNAPMHQCTNAPMHQCTNANITLSRPN